MTIAYKRENHHQIPVLGNTCINPLNFDFFLWYRRKIVLSGCDKELRFLEGFRNTCQASFPIKQDCKEFVLVILRLIAQLIIFSIQ